MLHIVAKQETYTSQGLTKNYTSARLNAKFAFTYGRVDVRAKIPVGAGTWPAIWTLGKNINENGAYWDSQYGTTSWPACGEIDMMEHGIFPNQNINYIKSSLHTPCCHAGNPNGGGTIASDLENDFHVYSLNWSPDQITFLLDGVGYYTYNPAVKNDSTWPFYEDQFVLLNLAMGGIAGDITSGFDQATMLIDYVKVYQEGELNTDTNLDLEDTVSVYPNPATNIINLSASVALSSVEVYDVSGKLLLTKEKDLTHIDVKEYASGVYFLVINVNNQQVVKKVIVK
jgi:beta-glucanase (GH16 family)